MLEKNATKHYPTETERLQWFRDAKFGLFIHWGLYAQLAGYYEGKPVRGIGEQIMRFGEIPVVEYMKLAKEFNPVLFDADEWVRIAVDAGMKYLVITSKHHDGFAMFKSRVSDFNIVDATPYSKDPLKELARACQEQGIKLCFYYSQYQDWIDPDGAFFWKQWPGTYPDEGKLFESYMDQKAIPQIVELLTNYGPIGLIWYDTPGGQTKYNARRFRDIVHAVQPDCIVGPRVGHDQGDYIGYGDNQVPNDMNSVPWESPATMNDTWGFKQQDTGWKDVGTLLRLLVSIVSKGGNYLLNVGPTKEGLIPEASKERLAAIGQWMRKNGESIYGAKGCLLSYTPPWGALTASEDRIYLHLFQWKAGRFVLSGLENKVTGAYALATGEKIPFAQMRNTEANVHQLILQLPKTAPDANVSVIVLDIQGDACMDQTLVEYGDTIVLPAHKAQIASDEDVMPALRGAPALRVDRTGVLENWYRKIDFVTWTFKVLVPGTYRLAINTYTENQTSACEDMPWEGGHVFVIESAGQQFEMILCDDDRSFPPTLFHRQNVASFAKDSLVFEKPGTYTLVMRPMKLVTELGLGPRLESIVLKMSG